MSDFGMLHRNLNCPDSCCVCEEKTDKGVLICFKLICDECVLEANKILAKHMDEED